MLKEREQLMNAWSVCPNQTKLESNEERLIATIFLDLSETQVLSWSMLAASRPKFPSRDSGHRLFGHSSQWQNVHCEKSHRGVARENSSMYPNEPSSPNL